MNDLKKTSEKLEDIYVQEEEQKLIKKMRKKHDKAFKSHPFKIMFKDLSKEKQAEYLVLAGLSSPEESDFDKYPVTTVYVTKFMTREQFQQLVEEI